MKKLFGLTTDDLRILRKMIQWFKGGGPGKSRRPVPTRRRTRASGKPPTILLGQATTAVASGTSTFLIDNIIVVEGSDPRPSPVGPTQTISVKNTFALDIADNAWVFAIKSDADGLYETWRPGEGTDPPVIRRGRLTADFAISDTSVAAELLNDDGTVDGTAITLTDNLQRFQGYGPYTDSEDVSQPGFHFTAIRYINGSAQERWYIIDIERLYPSILVALNEDVGTGTGGFETDFLKGYGNSYRTPKRISAGVMSTFNTNHLADGALNTEEWVANYDPVNDRYELIHGPSRDPVTVLVTGTVAAASLSSSTITDGTGQGKLMKRNGSDNGYVVDVDPVDLVNTSMTPIIGSTGTPIALQCYKIPGSTKYQISSIMDHRSGPNYTKGENQRWIHLAGVDQFELQQVCDKDQVTDVLIASDELRKKTIPWDGSTCTETETKIADIGPCDTP